MSLHSQHQKDTINLKVSSIFRRSLQHALSSGFLDCSLSSILASTYRMWRLGSPFGDFDTHPLAPVQRRRYKGFGKRTVARSTSHDTPAVELFCHWAWVYLEPHSRYSLTCAIPILGPYARLLQIASTRRHDIQRRLREPRPKPDTFVGLQAQRARYMGAAFILFDCNYVNLIRWLGGEYTNQHRDWSALRSVCDNARSFPTPDNYPVLDFDLTHRVFTEGVPLRGHFTCSGKDTWESIQYDNHPPVTRSLDDVRAKFAAEEASSFHVGLSRFLPIFISGLLFSPKSWIVQKGKGRIIIDASTT
jgi:hypothetical protein